MHSVTSTEKFRLPMPRLPMREPIHYNPDILPAMHQHGALAALASRPDRSDERDEAGRLFRYSEIRPSGVIVMDELTTLQVTQVDVDLSGAPILSLLEAQ